MQEEDKLVNIHEASRLLGVTASTLRRWDKEGRLKALPRNALSDKRMFRWSDVQKMLKGDYGHSTTSTN